VEVFDTRSLAQGCLAVVREIRKGEALLGYARLHMLFSDRSERSDAQG
jgi:hypothetical protein